MLGKVKYLHILENEMMNHFC